MEAWKAKLDIESNLETKQEPMLNALGMPTVNPRARVDRSSHNGDNTELIWNMIQDGRSIMHISQV